MRSLVRSLLSDLADEIHDYGDGFDALAHYETCLPDWSVVDVFMPELDGLAVTAWIKTHYPEARVAIMTQDNNPQLRDLALKVGATAFVPKDDLSQLRGLISPSPDSDPTPPENPSSRLSDS